MTKQTIEVPADMLILSEQEAWLVRDALDVACRELCEQADGFKRMPYPPFYEFVHLHKKVCEAIEGRSLP